MTLAHLSHLNQPNRINLKPNSAKLPEKLKHSNISTSRSPSSVLKGLLGFHLSKCYRHIFVAVESEPKRCFDLHNGIQGAH